MYAISSDNDRRPSDTGPERPELPILFHLADVSRPRPTVGDALLAGATGGPARAAEPVLLATAATQPSVAPPLSSAFEYKPSPTLALPPVSTELKPLETVVLKPVALNTRDEPLDAVVEQPASSESVAAVPPGSKPAVEPTPTVTLKSKTTERRQRKTSASEDWFAAHGKFIALAFVVALIGTVYFARTNRPQATPAKTEAAGQSPLAERRSEESPAESTTKSVQTIAAVSDSKIELQAPSAPALITSTSNEGKSMGADKLFDFPAAAKAEQRVAMRPSGSGTDAARTAAQPPAAKETESSARAIAPAYPVTTSPAAYPSTTATPSAYPQTSAPALPSAPALQAPANATPDYRSQFPAQSYQQPAFQQQSFQQPAAQQPAPSTGWSPPTSNGPSQYQPTDNTARGPRYERTGSSPY